MSTLSSTGPVAPHQPQHEACRSKTPEEMHAVSRARTFRRLTEAATRALTRSLNESINRPQR